MDETRSDDSQQRPLAGVAVACAVLLILAATAFGIRLRPARGPLVARFTVTAQPAPNGIRFNIFQGVQVSRGAARQIMAAVWFPQGRYRGPDGRPIAATSSPAVASIAPRGSWQPMTAVMSVGSRTPPGRTSFEVAAPGTAARTALLALPARCVMTVAWEDAAGRWSWQEFGLGGHALAEPRTIRPPTGMGTRTPAPHAAPGGAG